MQVKNGDLAKRLVSERNWKVLVEIQDRVDSEALTPSLRREARIVARFFLLDAQCCWRDDAVTVLGAVGNRNDWFALKVACSDSEWVVRCSAYSSLAEIGGKQQFRFLQRATLGERHPVARRWAYVAVYDADRDRAVPWLRERWAVEKDLSAEVGILSCLADEGDAAAIERVKVLAETDNWRINSFCQDILNGLE